MAKQERVLQTTGSNIGHGWVHPRPDGMRARCGGPGMCSECSREQAALRVVPSPSLAPASPARTLIAFTGLAGSGKSTAAEHLVNNRGFTRVRFAGPLKAMMAALGLTPAQVDGELKETPCDLLCGKTPRQAMQWLGTEFGRDMIGPDLWIRAWQAALVNAGQYVVVDDVRFPNEADAILANGGVLVRIERNGAGTGSVHASEQQELQSARTIHNTLDKANLRGQVDDLIRDWSWAQAALTA